MRTVRVTVTGVADSSVIPLDHLSSTSGVAIGVKIDSGTATYTVQHTFDDVFSPTFSAGSAVWYSHATLVAQTSNADGNYAYPPVAMRLHVTVSSGGTCTMTVNQVGTK